MKLPPQNAREALAVTNPNFRGWVAESAEAAAAPYEYENDPRHVIQMVDRIKARVARSRPRRFTKP